MRNLEEETNIFFGRLFDYNTLLLKRSNHQKEAGSYRFTDIIDFYITSHALSIVKSINMKLWGSIGLFQNSRCVLEGIALKRMYEAGDISEDQVDLLQSQAALMEYKYYSRFDEIIDQIVFPEELKKSYDRACVAFYRKLNGKYSEKEVKNILRSNVPFLCDPRINFHSLILKYLGKAPAKAYSIFSQAVHPSDNTAYKNKDFHALTQITYDFLCAEYGNLPSSQGTFNNYIKMCMTSPVPRMQHDIVSEQSTILLGILNVFQGNFGDNYISDSLNTFVRLKHDLLLDCQLGFREQAKVKWKNMLEFLASFYFVCMDPCMTQRLKLITAHGNMKLNQSLDTETDFDSIYTIYKGIYPAGCKKEKFIKSFCGPTGYTINEDGKTLQLAKLVDIFLQRIYGPETEMQQIVKLDYCESQMLSHANGYMWFANSGAWMDIYSIFFAIETGMAIILDMLRNVFNIIRQKDTSGKYHTVVNVLRNGTKKYQTCSKRLLDLLKIPATSIL